MRFSLNNKVAIVTGGGSGIGKAMSITFAEMGATVHILEKNIAAGKATVAEITAAKGRAFCHECDVTNQKQVLSIFAGINAAEGGIDILINNAAISDKGKFEKRLNKEMIDTFEINLLVPLKLINFVCNQNNKSKDKVILNIASIYGLISPDHNLYLENKKNFYWQLKNVLKSHHSHIPLLFLARFLKIEYQI